MCKRPFCLAVPFSHKIRIYSAQANPIYYSANNYESPALTDCVTTLSGIVSASHSNFFVEQQLRTLRPLRADWLRFEDHRPGRHKELLVQSPKWWSYHQAYFASSDFFVSLEANEAVNGFKLIDDCIDNHV